MSIQVADNFEYKGTKPLDGRVKYATLALMKAASEATLYDGILAYVDATDKYYKFLSSNTVDVDTGKWREYSSGGGGGSTVSIGTDGTAAYNSEQCQKITIDGTGTAIDGTKFLELTQNAQANTDITFTFSHADLKYDSVLDIFAGCKTADYDAPSYKSKTLTVSGGVGTLALVYNVPTAYALTVRVYIRG